MKTLVNVGRYHLVDRVTYVALPWAILAFSFLVNLAIFAVAPVPSGGSYTGGLASIYIFLFICGALSMTRELPFGLMLGVSRRVYYLGTALLVLALGIVYGLALTVLQAVERASGGWGLSRALLRHGAGTGAGRRAGRAHHRHGARRVQHHAPGRPLRAIRHGSSVARRFASAPR